MAVQAVFCVTGIETDLSTKTVVIETNFNVKSPTVNLNNIKLYNVDDNDIKLVVPYKLKLDGSNIMLFLENYPKPNSKYYLLVKDLKDELGRDLYNMYSNYIYFDYDIKSKIDIIAPTDLFVSETNDVEIKINISDEEKESKYRFEIASDTEFFNKEEMVFKDNNHDVYLSDSENYKIIGAYKDGNIISILLKIKNNGQYYLRARSEKSHYIVGDWSNPITFKVITTTPLEDQTGYLDDFLSPNEIFKEEFKELEVLNKTPSAITTQDFYIEFNKDIKFIQSTDSKYSEEGLLYISKGYMIRRDY